MKASLVLIALIGLSVVGGRHFPGPSEKQITHPPKALRDGDPKFWTVYWTEIYGSTDAPATTKAPSTTKAPTTTKAPATTKPPTSTGTCQCGVANPTRIVGGSEVNPKNKYFYQIGIKMKGGSNYWCGGSIINDRYVLSAAHCFFEDGNQISADGLVVGVGDHLMDDNSDDVAATELIDVASIIVHSQYDPNGYDYDVALLKLSKVLTFSAEVSPVCLPADDSKTYAGAMGIASGWGTLSSGGSQPDALQEVALPILDPTCWGQSVTARMLCAGYEAGGKDTCQGDSGGPLVVTESSKFYQVGVTSFGSGCANPKSAGVYARVSKFLDFIRSNTNDATYC